MLDIVGIAQSFKDAVFSSFLLWGKSFNIHMHLRARRSNSLTIIPHKFYAPSGYFIIGLLDFRGFLLLADKKLKLKADIMNENHRIFPDFYHYQIKK